MHQTINFSNLLWKFDLLKKKKLISTHLNEMNRDREKKGLMCVSKQMFALFYPQKYKNITKSD